MPEGLYARKLVCKEVGMPCSWYSLKLVCQEVGKPGC